MNRRDFMLTGNLLASAAVFSNTLQALASDSPAHEPVRKPPAQASEGSAWTSRRPPAEKRAFTTAAVEAKIREVRGKIRNPELAWLFENCYPNTLDTTVALRMQDGQEDTFVITGDIPAMWLRDSTAQTTPYMSLAKNDPKLQAMFRGLLHRQAKCVLLDPYANAFYAEPSFGEWRNDETEMKPGVHERKWELDSLCYPVRLAYQYWRTTGDRAPFDDRWHNAARLIAGTCRIEQRLQGDSPYRFARKTDWFYDNSPNRGLGNPTRKIGLIHSIFRPSDDGCFYPFLIPSNLFAEVSLHQLAALAEEVFHDDALRTECLSLAGQLQEAVKDHAIAHHPVHGPIYAFEVDGFGNALMMDDANAPSLLSLPYLGCCSPNDPLYQRTRAFVLSDGNPFFHRGQFAEGISGPHVAPNMIWPLSIIMRALTSVNDGEIVACLRMLLATHARSGFMHESLDPDHPEQFTRPWFAWCNSLFGELIATLADNKPQVLAGSCPAFS